MARGRLLKTQVKEARNIAEAIAAGGQKAEKKKDWSISLKEHMGKMIDRIDPLEAAAMISLTIIIHDTYDWSTAILAKYKVLSISVGLGLLGGPKPRELYGGIGEALEKVPDPIIWLISFIASFYVLRHGKDMLSAVSGVIGMLGLV